MVSSAVVRPRRDSALPLRVHSVELLMGNTEIAGIADLKANMEELTMLFSEYSELCSTAMPLYEENRKKIWASDKISTKLQITAKSPNKQKSFYFLATGCSEC